MAVQSHMSTKAVQREREWDEWLMSLNPWERHYVFTHHDMEWFDSWVAGTADFDVFNTILASKFMPDEDGHSKSSKV